MNSHIGTPHVNLESKKSQAFVVFTSVQFFRLLKRNQSKVDMNLTPVDGL